MQLWIHLWELGVERRFSSRTFCSLFGRFHFAGRHENIVFVNKKTRFNEFSLETIVCLFNECNHFPAFCWGPVPAGPQVCSMKAWAWLEVLFESWTDCVFSDFMVMVWLIKVICHQFPRLLRWDHTFWRISVCVCVCGCYLITIVVCSNNHNMNVHIHLKRSKFVVFLAASFYS